VLRERRLVRARLGVCVPSESEGPIRETYFSADSNSVCLCQTCSENGEASHLHVRSYHISQLTFPKLNVRGCWDNDTYESQDLERRVEEPDGTRDLDIYICVLATKYNVDINAT
jgi:hypothetical protein